jgi:dephospho-CoA kinase
VRVLGLTGDIASGKSTVAALLEQHGARVLDADLLVHELYSDPAFAQKVAALFSGQVLDETGCVNRKALGAIVFNNSVALQRLEALVHPAVAALREAKLEVLRTQPEPNIVVLEAVKLIESGQARGCEEVWCVVSTPEVQLQRLMQQRGLSEDAARTRLAAQPSREAKLAQLKYSAPGAPLLFLTNNGTHDELARAVEREWQRFLSSRATASR